MTTEHTPPATPLQQLPDGGNALIQGASRGIGLGFVRHLLDHSQLARVYASCRHPDQAEDLHALQQHHGERLQLLALDLSDEASIHAAAAHIADDGGRLHLLVNAAGILHSPEGLAPEKKLADIRPDALLQSFQVNAVGPLLMAKHFWSLLNHDQRAVFASISARVGSISDNQIGGWYAYRAAKAAQNQFTRTLAVEFGRRARRLITVALHPGTTDTDLSRPFQGNVPEGKLFPVAYSVACLLNVIDGLSTEDSGSFFDYAGERIPW